MRLLRYTTLFLLTLISTCIQDSAWSQRVSNEERQTIKSLKAEIEEGSKLLRLKKTKEAIEAFGQLRDHLLEQSVGARPELQKLIEPEFERLKKFRKSLVDAGNELPDLPDLKKAFAEKKSEPVSFEKEIAPILVAKCGNCHVNRAQGNFSMASFDALDKSTKLAYGLPDDSRLIEVIVKGEMPKGGLKVEEKEMDLLKSWIKQGAKFDGNDRNQNLRQLVNGNRRDADDEVKVEMATGKEKISFGLQIAPILVENCGQCHMVDNPRGNFSQNSFERLLRGGDSGKPIKPGKSKESPLYNRIAAGEMPPTGKLPQKSIDLIKAWIDEGAKFDGGSPRVELAIVATVSKAKSQTHSELIADRQKLLVSNWKLAMGDTIPINIESESVRVVGGNNEPRLKQISERIEYWLPKIGSTLKAAKDAPFVKGNVSVFVFDKRYDLSEFGKMVSKREIEKSGFSFWNFTVSDAFASLLLTKNQEATDGDPFLVQQLAAIHVASLNPDIPRWFSEGVGHWTSAKLLPKDENVVKWEAASAEAVLVVKDPDELLRNRLTDQELALVGYRFVKELKKKGGSFDRLLGELRNGESFEEAFKKAYGGTPKEFLSGGR